VTRARVEFFLASRPAMPEALIRAVLGSVAQLAVIPLQDLLGLGSEARFNRPGTITGNWQWRVPSGALDEALAQHCAQLNAAFGRA
jgi:4-alpha-glucanotransferase